MSDREEKNYRWPPPLAELRGLEIDHLQFIFEQAKRLLDDTIEVRRSFENKLISFMVVGVPTALALYGAVFGLVRARIETTLFVAVVYSACAITVSIIICLFLFRPTKRYRDGSLPSEMYQPDWVESSSDIAMKNYLANEIVSYDKRCQYNLKLGYRQTSWFSAAIYLTTSSLFAFLLAAAFELLPILFRNPALWAFHS